MPGAERVDLTNCDREPIHIPGSIQPHGCLLACDADLAVIRRHSVNTAEMLGVAGNLTGESFEIVLGSRAAHDIRNALAAVNDPSRPALLLSLPVASGRKFDVAAHVHKGVAIVELEEGAEAAGDPISLARAIFGRLRRLANVDDVLRQTPRLMRAFLGYDRVMVYQFAHDGSGQVVAEAKQEELESFLGQYFPASDIPRQARELYLKNTIRIISDADCNRVAIEPEVDASGEALDLSFAHLRSVSPIHCEYLRNMGVAASMSISIIVGGELWGLIACHHYSPRSLAMAQRTAAEMFGDLFSLQLEATLQKNRLDAAMLARRGLDNILRDITSHTDVESFLLENVATFAALMPSDGVGIWLNGMWSSHGYTPPKNAIPALARFIAGVSEGRVWATHELAAALPHFDAYSAQTSGVLSVPLSQIPRDFLFFFRKEVIQTVEWAGNPQKTYESGPLGDRLTPRKSFAIWKETVEQQSRPWTTEDREIGESVRTGLLEVIMRQTEMLTAERRKADLRQKMLNEELNHRVKNILALIKSVVSQPAHGRTLEEYVSALKGRIMALSFAHDQVVRSDGGGSLRDLLDAELSPHRGDGNAVVLEGPDVGLDSRAYSVMALVIHEMATNAAKYGSLSIAGGRLAVRWGFDTERGCVINWVEQGGPLVSTPARRGFGAVLVERSIPFDLGGECELRFDAAGVVARFAVPAKFVSPVSLRRTDVRGTAQQRLEGAATVAGLQVLVVEDQLVIAMDVENVLAEHGAKTVDTVATSAEALRIVASKELDVAILDVNLGIGTSIPVAEELERRKVPFIFATGYGDTAMIPRSMAAVPVLRKPHDAESLIAALSSALGSD